MKTYTKQLLYPLVVIFCGLVGCNRVGINRNNMHSGNKNKEKEQFSIKKGNLSSTEDGVIYHSL